MLCKVRGFVSLWPPLHTPSYCKAHGFLFGLGVEGLANSSLLTFRAKGIVIARPKSNLESEMYGKGSDT